MSRKLTTEEIEYILSVFDDYRGLDPDTREYVHKKICDKIRPQLERACLDPGLISKLRGELARVYRAVEPGKAVGIITAQSVGEMQTQMNLNVFHRAGYRDSQVENASRLQELTCTSKSITQQSVSMSIFIKKDTSREEMMQSIVHKTLFSYILSYSKNPSTRTEPWEDEYDTFFERPSNIIENRSYKYRLQLDLESMYRFRITLAEIAARVNEAREVEITFSRLHIGQMCIYCTHEELKLCFEVYIHGVEKIKQAYFLPKSLNSHELFIETEGSNFEKILKLDFVDAYHTMTNDMWEIYNLFGIEAVRAFLAEELQSIMGGVHFSHIEFLSDRMTISGHLKSITRYTRKTETRASTLSKITFEETVKRATEAAFKEHVDNTRGCSASVIVGKPPSTGSGMNQLFYEL